MSYCKKCFEEVSNDCILTNGICVFCHYHIDDWDTNGHVVTKKQSIRNHSNIFLHWRKYYNKYYRALCKKLSTLIKGTIRKRKIKKHFYYYLYYRDGGKIMTKYYGRNCPTEVLTQIELRRKIQLKIKNLKPLLYALRINSRPNHYYNRFDILKRDNFTCRYCGRRAPEVKLHVDHKIPLSKGGRDIKSNYITCCEDCNLEKLAKV